MSARVGKRTRRHESPQLGCFAGLLVATVSIGGCGSEAEPRAQLLIIVDTDAPVPGQLIDASLSRQAAIDTLRVDVFDADGSVREYQTFAVSEASDLPLSFGITSPDDRSSVRVRLRMFKAQHARVEVLGGEPVLEPTPGTAIDRLVELPMTEAGVERRLIRLSFDCMGASATFSAGGTTCIDGDRSRASPTDGVETIGEEAILSSRVGTAERAREQPCRETVDDALCIPGGFSFMGDAEIWGLGAVSNDARPMRPVVLLPFALDALEMSVGRYRALLLLQPGLPEPVRGDDGDAFTRDCTWLGVEDASNDEYPLNCVSDDVASQICGALGGRLPTEAQWEHAARGRGLGYRFPWGDSKPACCTASYFRAAYDGGSSPCGAIGPETVGSHASTDTCNGLGDVSLDGVLDLGGSVSEITRDPHLPYDDACWSTQEGPLTDPSCESAAAILSSSRGGSWGNGPAFLLSAARRPAFVDAQTGFRCAYELMP